MSTIKLNDLAKDLAAARRGVEQLHEADRKLREAHAAATKARDRIIGAWQPADAVVAAMESEIDARAAHWAQEHGRSLVGAFGGGLQLKMDGSLVPRRPQLPDWLTVRDLTGADLIALVPDLLKARFAAVIRATSYEPGPPAADRERLLAEADERIATIEREHEQLVDFAARLEPPITFTHLPAVQERKQQEAVEARRNAAAAEARRQAEAAVNAQEPAPRVGPSAYLTGQAARRAGQTG